MSAFTEEETNDLIRLLKKVGDNNYRFPSEECMRAAHGIISMWAVEIIITRLNRRKKEILLTGYEGGAEWFHNKWHIPGGYNKWPQPDIQAACSSVAVREFGTDVGYIRVIDAYKWHQEEHPYGRPLSLYVECVPKRPIQETDKCHFFAKNALPENLIEPHRRFIQKYL